MKISLLTIVVELLIYAWLYLYRYHEVYSPDRDVGVPLVILIDFFPYILFIVRNVLTPKPTLIYNWIVALLLLITDNVSIYYDYISYIGFSHQNVYIDNMKPMQIMLALPFFLIEYLVCLILLKRSNKGDKVSGSTSVSSTSENYVHLKQGHPEKLSLQSICISLLALIVELSIYWWLYRYKHYQIFTDMKDKDVGMTVLIFSVPYILFIIRMIVKFRFSPLYSLIIFFILVGSECAIYYYSYVADIFLGHRDTSFYDIKATQVAAFTLFFLIDYLARSLEFTRQKRLTKRS